MMNTAITQPSYEELLLENSLLKADNLELQSQIKLIQFQLLELRRQIFGSKSERFISPNNSMQLPLDLQVEAIADKEVREQEVKAHTRQAIEIKPKNHKGRVPFGSHIKRVVTVLAPNENTTGLKTIGVEVTETLEYTPGSFYINRTERPKYAKAGNEGVLIAQLPERVLGKSMFGNSFAAHVLVSKFVDHQPEYRQIQILKREDVHIAYTSFNDISAKVAHCLLMLHQKLTDRVLAQRYLQVDETTGRVLTDESPGTTHQGYYWVYRSPLENLVLFDYRPNRKADGPNEMLKNFKGKLQTDGYSVYDEFGKRDDITLFHCWAHARRYFDKALINDKERAIFMMEQIQLLYAVERKAKQEQMSFDERLKLRQKESWPILETIKQWITKNTPSVTPKSPIGKAIKYTAKRWQGLTHYITDGKLEIDNNWVENSIRPLTLGRKNYLFAGSHEGACRAAILYSFFGTCKLRGVNPYTWLKDTLDKLPFTKPEDLHTLLPSQNVVQN